MTDTYTYTCTCTYIFGGPKGNEWGVGVAPRSLYLANVIPRLVDTSRMRAHDCQHQVTRAIQLKKYLVVVTFACSCNVQHVTCTTSYKHLCTMQHMCTMPHVEDRYSISYGYAYVQYIRCASYVAEDSHLCVNMQIPSYNMYELNIMWHCTVATNMISQAMPQWYN